MRKGGETIENLIKAIDEFLRFMGDDNARLMHAQEIREKISRLPPYEHLRTSAKRALFLLNDSRFWNESSKKLCVIKRKYERIVEQHYPIVYALRIEPAWFKRWNDVVSLQNKDELISIQDIVSSCIIARIDYPEGVTRFELYDNAPLPVPWAISKFKEWLEEQHSRVQDINIVNFYK